MYIPKPVHSLLAGALSGIAAVAAFALLRGRIGLWAALIALVCLPPAWLLGSVVVDLADGALRRATRHRAPPSAAGVPAMLASHVSRGEAAVDLPRRPWARGAVIGLMVAAVVPAALWTGTEGESGLKTALQFLAAIPPFLYHPLLSAPQPLLWALFAAWWAGVGALVGWRLGHGVRGRVGVGLLLAVLIAAHLKTLGSIERGLAGAADAVTRILRAIFAP